MSSLEAVVLIIEAKVLGGMLFVFCKYCVPQRTGCLNKTFVRWEIVDINNVCFPCVVDYQIKAKKGELQLLLQ